MHIGHHLCGDSGRFVRSITRNRYVLGHQVRYNTYRYGGNRIVGRHSTTHCCRSSQRRHLRWNHRIRRNALVSRTQPYGTRSFNGDCCSCRRLVARLRCQRSLWCLRQPRPDSQWHFHRHPHPFYIAHHRLFLTDGSYAFISWLNHSTIIMI